MAGIADTLRGDGLARVYKALDGLEADPLGLDRMRRRFSQSPPTYTSNPSGTTTRSASSEPPSDQQRRREQWEERFHRRRKLMDERAASLPLQQFEAQRGEETRRIWDTNPRTNWMSKIPVEGTEEKEATETIRKRWIEQGIWKEKWDEMAAGRNYMEVGKWKHEEPLELESELETDTAESPPPTFSIFGVPQNYPQLKPRRPKSNNEKQRVAERRAARKREREASRPYHQFVYQISKERERIQGESANGEGAGAANINTRAYENIKNTWINRGIWNGIWGILPGMSWKHEEPLKEGAADDPTLVPANPLVNGSLATGEAPTTRIFGSPCTSNSPPSRSCKRILRPTTGEALRPSNRKGSLKRQPTNPSLSLVHSSKVSKTAGKRKGPQRRPNISQKVFSDGLPFSSGVDAAEPQPSSPPDSVTLRKSKRLQPPVSSVAKDSAKADSTKLSQRAVGSKPERKMKSNLTSRSAAKPQGVSKRRPAKTTRGKAREK